MWLYKMLCGDCYCEYDGDTKLCATCEPLWIEIKKNDINKKWVSFVWVLHSTTTKKLYEKD